MRNFYYFGYGSNLHLGQMNARCPGNTFLGAALLMNYRLAERRFADIDHCPGGAVFGALFRITREDLRNLDRYEGFPGLYTRYAVTVELLPDWMAVSALVYEMMPWRKHQLRRERFSSDYRRICADGARMCGLPYNSYDLEDDDEPSEA